MTQKKKKYFALIIYSLYLYSVWAVFVLCVEENIGSVWTGIIKTIIWVLPAMLLVRRFRDSVQIGLKEMFTTKVKLYQYIWMYAILAIWVLLGGFFQSGGLSFVIDFDSMVIVLFVGITEEMAFRGWLLNATIDDIPQWLAISINAIMFLVIHFPRWIQEGIFVGLLTSFSFVGIIALSVIFSISFIKSKNILIPVTMHMLYDLMMFVLLPQAP